MNKGVPLYVDAFAFTINLLGKPTAGRNVPDEGSHVEVSHLQDLLYRIEHTAVRFFAFWGDLAKTMPQHHEARIKQLCAQAIQLPDSSPELKKVIAELQAVLREQTAGMRALAAEAIMSRPEVVSPNGSNNADFRESDQVSGLKAESEGLQSEQLQSAQIHSDRLDSDQQGQEVKSSRNLFSSILRIVLQNPQ